MADITWTHVTDHTPDLSTVAAAVQTDILAYVNAELKVSELDGETGPKTKLARVYLASHFATAGINAASADGPITAEKLGDESRSYGTFDMGGSALATTGFGMQYLMLVRSSVARVPLIV